MSAYTVKSNLKLNGVQYAEGEKIELEEAEAKPLLESGTIVAEGSAASPEAGGEEGGEGVEKSKYKVLQDLEYPEGASHEVGAILELTEEETAGFAEGTIEKVEDEDASKDL